MRYRLRPQPEPRRQPQRGIGSAVTILVVCALFVPVSLSHSRAWDTAGRAVEAIRQNIEANVEPLADGTRVFIHCVPQDEMPPYYFGWSLQSALRPPFAKSNIPGRLKVVNSQNLWMTGRIADPEAVYDVTLDYPMRLQRIAQK